MSKLSTPARLGLATLVLALPAGATTYHVDAGAAPPGNGLSWATAFHSLDSALARAGDADQVWVKAGTYLPSVRRTSWDPRTASFRPTTGVELYGGFDGTETTLAQRAGLFDQTLLDGDLGAVGDKTDNAYHVLHVSVSGQGPWLTTVIDGFTIRGGNADAFSIDNYGGGVYSTNAFTTLVNCTVRDNHASYGAGLAAPLMGRIEVLESSFLDNTARYKGGAMWGGTMQFFVYNSEFRGNHAGNKGGAVAVRWTTPVANQFQNVVFEGNSANVGGAVWMAGGPNYNAGGGSFINCTFAYNVASSGGGALKAETKNGVSARSVIKNSILWFNTAPNGPQLRGPHTVVFSDVQGGWPGKGNKNLDPLFMSTTDLRLRQRSGARNRGHYKKVLPDYFDLDGDGDRTERTPYDLLGNPRAVAPHRIDMGAYEVQ